MFTLKKQDNGKRYLLTKDGSQLRRQRDKKTDRQVVITAGI